MSVGNSYSLDQVVICHFESMGNVNHFLGLVKTPTLMDKVKEKLLLECDRLLLTTKRIKPHDSSLMLTKSIESKDEYVIYDFNKHNPNFSINGTFLIQYNGKDVIRSTPFEIVSNVISLGKLIQLGLVENVNNPISKEDIVKIVVALEEKYKNNDFNFLLQQPKGKKAL